MRVDCRFDAKTSTLWFDAEPEPDDRLEKFNATPVFFRMPKDWRPEHTHPDLLALSGIVLLHPFVGSSLTISSVVSTDFDQACRAVLPYVTSFEAVRDASALPARTPGRTPGLSFSGGVDSTAALALMPEATQLFFLDRETLPGVQSKSIYVKDSAIVACELAQSLGYTVYRIATNLEFVRQPIGFPIDWSSGLPALLMADYSGLSSISWGVVAESAYRVGHEHFIDFPRRTIFRRWNQLLQAVGLCLGAPVAGLSEVCTSRIVMNSRLAKLAQSCIRGPKNEPCLRCFKCLRKRMLDAVLDDRELPAEEFERMVRFHGFEKIMLKLPIKHEDVFRWIAPRLRLAGASAAWPALLDRLELGDQPMDWAEHWYPKAAPYIPPEFRDETIGRIESSVGRMSEAQIQAFEAWDLRPAFAMDEAERRVEALSAMLAPAAAAPAHSKSPSSV